LVSPDEQEEYVNRVQRRGGHGCSQ
jgi:hypothetical protein